MPCCCHNARKTLPWIKLASHMSCCKFCVLFVMLLQRARRSCCRLWLFAVLLSPRDTCLQILVELAELQDSEVGDGTTSVVIVAAELLKRANELVRNKIHPTSIISGYRLAMREANLPLLSTWGSQQMHRPELQCALNSQLHCSDCR